MPHQVTISYLLRKTPKSPVQGELFTRTRQLPIMKSGPEDVQEKPRMPIWSQALADKQTRH